MNFHPTPIFDEMTVTMPAEMPYLEHLFGKHAEQVRLLDAAERAWHRPVVMPLALPAGDVHVVTGLAAAQEFRNFRSRMRDALLPPRSTGVGLDILTRGDRP